MAGAAAAVAGGVILLGWLVRAPALVHLFVSPLPTAFEAAVGMVLAGLAVAFWRPGPAGTLLGAAALTLGVVAAAAPYVPVLGTPSPPADFLGAWPPPPTRMAPATAISLVLVGAGRLALAARRTRSGDALLAALLGSAAAVFGLAVLTASLAEILPSARLGAPQQMTPQSAAALALSGLGLVLAAWARQAERPLDVPRWLAPLVAVDAMAIVLLLWSSYERQQDTLMAHSARQGAAGAASEIEAELRARLDVLMYMAERWRFRGQPSRTAWGAEASYLITTDPETWAVAWYPEPAAPRWVETAPKVPSPRAWNLPLAALAQPEPSVGGPIDLPGDGSGVVLSVPVHVGARAAGHLVWILRLHAFLDDVLERDRALGHVLVLEDATGRPLWRTDPHGPRERIPSASARIEFAQIAWRLKAWPESLARARRASRLGEAALVAGLIFGLLLGGVVHLARLSRQGEAALRREMAEREKAELALRQREALYRAIFDHSAMGIARADPDGLILDYNGAFQRMLGRTGREPGGRHFTSITHPEDAPTELGLFRELLEGRRSVYSMEKRFFRADGTVMWAQVTASLVRDPRGRPAFAVVLVEDVTERRQARARIETMNRELAGRNEDLERFASVVAHDLKEPLLTVRLFAEHLATEHGERMAPEGQDYLERIRRSASRMQELIQSLLEYTRVKTQAAPLRPVELSEVVREVLSDLEGRIRAASGRVEVGALPRVEGDPAQLRQLFQNLVGNALKFNRPGVPPEVHIRAERARLAGRPAWRLEVRDNGIGFEPADAEHLFEPFRRLRGASGYEGTGMGLAICRQIVERHGGTLEAQGRPGAGATFAFTLPAAD